MAQGIELVAESTAPKFDGVVTPARGPSAGAWRAGGRQPPEFGTVWGRLSGETSPANELRDGRERVSIEQRVGDDLDLHMRELPILMARRMSRGHGHHGVKFVNVGVCFAHTSHLSDLGNSAIDLITPIGQRVPRVFQPTASQLSVQCLRGAENGCAGVALGHIAKGPGDPQGGHLCSHDDARPGRSSGPGDRAWKLT